MMLDCDVSSEIIFNLKEGKKDRTINKKQNKTKQKRTNKTKTKAKRKNEKILSVLLSFIGFCLKMRWHN